MSVLADPRLRRAALVAAVVLALDQGTKALVQRTMRLHQSIRVTSFFDLTYLRSTPVERTWTVVALGAILGGALGNLVCRVRYGEVVDFVYLHWGEWYWPAFNVADSAISVGVAVVLLESLRGGGAQATEEPATTAR